MAVYYFQDDVNVRTNSVTVVNGCGPSYNAVLSVTFSDDGTEVEPITLQEAKDWCRIDVTDDDAIITALIKAARIVCENHANLSFIERTVTARIVNGLGNFTLPYGPVTSITTVTLFDGTDISTGFDINKANGNVCTVVYEAGFTVLPENLRTAVLNQIAWMYDNRGNEKLARGLSELSKLLLNQVRYV